MEQAIIQNHLPLVALQMHHCGYISDDIKVMVQLMNDLNKKTVPKARF